MRILQGKPCEPLSVVPRTPRSLNNYDLLLLSLSEYYQNSISAGETWQEGHDYSDLILSFVCKGMMLLV